MTGRILTQRDYLHQTNNPYCKGVLDYFDAEYCKCGDCGFTLKPCEEKYNCIDCNVQFTAKSWIYPHTDKNISNQRCSSCKADRIQRLLLKLML